jgi:acetyl esterase/lipase
MEFAIKKATHLVAVAALLGSAVAVPLVGCSDSTSSDSPAATAAAGSGGAAPTVATDSGGTVNDASNEEAPDRDAPSTEASREAGADERPPTEGFREMNIYSGDPPNLVANAPQENTSADGHVTNVSIPMLRRYPLDESKATGTAFIAFPGGGYVTLAMETDSAALARRLGPLGIAVFGLKYRVGSGSNDAPRDALLDAKRAIRLVRSNAELWALDPKRIGVISYSAGSDIAMNLVAGFDLGQVGATDPVERLSSRPDFVASMCTLAFGSATPPFTFSATAPPVYMCHAQDDTIAPIGLANAIEQQLQALGVLEHLEVYPTGGHFAFWVGDPTAPGRNWLDNYLPWLKNNQLTP